MAKVVWFRANIEAFQGYRRRFAAHSTLAGLCLGLAALGMFAPGCNWLFQQDTTPPLVAMVAPQDSALVTGTVTLQASASDSGSGVSSLEFLVDGAVVGQGTLNQGVYEFTWDASNLTHGAWHPVFARATDGSNNVGYSDTVLVKPSGTQELDIYHASFTIPAGYYVYIPFNGLAGDSLVGNVRVANTGTLSDFFWCDSANFVEFQAGRSFSANDRQQNQANCTVASLVPVNGRYDIVMRNQGSSDRVVWVRFSLRRTS